MCIPFFWLQASQRWFVSGLSIHMCVCVSMCIYIYISISICSLDIHDRNDIYFRSFFVTGLAALIPQRVPKGGCIYIYMCVCVCVCVCVCARARARARVCAYACTCVYTICMYLRVFMYTPIYFMYPFPCLYVYFCCRRPRSADSWAGAQGRRYRQGGRSTVQRRTWGRRNFRCEHRKLRSAAVSLAQVGHICHRVWDIHLLTRGVCTSQYYFWHSTPPSMRPTHPPHPHPTPHPWLLPFIRYAFFSSGIVH